MRIRISSHVFAVEQSSDRRVEVPRSVDGWTAPGSPLDRDLDSSLADLGVVGGIIRASYPLHGSPRLHVDYWAPDSLDEAALIDLREYTMAQFSDGVGEGGFEFVDGQRSYLLVGDLEHLLAIEQSDDGRATPAASLTARAARDGDLGLLAKTLASESEDVDATLQGYSGLHLAILYGRLDAATLLIERGANPNRLDPTGMTPLQLTALSNALNDETSVLLTQSLLKMGANPAQVEPGTLPAREYAELRRKPNMVRLLQIHP